MTDFIDKSSEEKVQKNKHALEQMEDMDIRTVDIDNLVELASVQVPKGGKQERIHSYLKQIRNPYCFRVGKVAVKVSFSDTDDTLEDKLVELLPKL